MVSKSLNTAILPFKNLQDIGNFLTVDEGMYQTNEWFILISNAIPFNVFITFLAHS